MGKSEVVPMPREGNLVCAGFDSDRKNGAIFIHEVLGEEPEEEDRLRNGTDIADGVEVYKNQVAGHTDDGKSFGLLKYDGKVLKPITNVKCGQRELHFYSELARTNDKVLVQLRQFVPKFYGQKSVHIKGQKVDCIVLEDLTKGFKEPCIMDIKIGRQTWDPTASAEKIARENMKYQECKRDTAFCIPGFQVYQLSTQQFTRYDKNYGRSLDRDSVTSAFRTFLNGDSGLSRRLLVQFLANLWRIQILMRQQRRFHFYASSLLLIYDARRLRESLKTVPKPTVRTKLQRVTSLYRPLSLAVLNKNTEDQIPTGFSGQLTNQGPILRTPTSAMKVKEFVEDAVQIRSGNVWQKSIRDLKRTHSFQNNYDKDMQNRRQNYTDMLDDLCDEQKSELWASVKMIDFAHAFPSEKHQVDGNYLEGVDSLVRIFESFLIDCN